MSGEDQEKCSASFARAAYATNCPFVMFEHPLWQEAFRQLRPTFKPPKKDAMGGRLLNNEYDRVMTFANDKIKGAPYLGIACDSYKNIRGDGLLNFVILTPEAVFFKTIELKDSREDSDYVADQVCNVIEEVNPEKVTVVITDNVEYNKVAWGKIKDRFPHIDCVGCGAHCLNLLMTDIGDLRSVIKLTKMAKILYKGIKNCRRASAVFQEAQKRLYVTPHTIKLPSKTRFWGIVILFETIYENKSAFQATVLEATTDPSPKDPEEKKKFYLKKKVKNIALDDDYFFPRLSEWIAAMKPIASAIESIESDSSLLSEVPQWFADIEMKTIAALEASTSGIDRFIPVVKGLIRERKEFACTEVHYAANLLDPRYKGATLKPPEKLQASEYISKLCDDLGMTEPKKQSVLSNLTEFRANAGIWALESVRNSFHGVKPALWWQVHCEDEPLMPLAVRLLTMPATAAAVERDWSCYTRTHTKVRNRLKNAKTEKLVAIQMNHKYSLPRHLVKKNTLNKKKVRGPRACDDAAVVDGEQEQDQGVDDEELEEVDLIDVIEDTDEDDDDDSDWEVNSDEDDPSEEMELPDVDLRSQHGTGDGQPRPRQVEPAVLQPRVTRRRVPAEPSEIPEKRMRPLRSSMRR